MSSCSEYYEWLMAIIDGPGRYSRVLDLLWHIEFYSIIPNDDNRAADGAELRYYYEDATGYICEKGGACTVLEMIIGLALRIENDFLYDEEFGDRTDIWFWDMFYCLGLGDYDDQNFEEAPVREIIEDFLDRRIDDKGRIRTLFPVIGSGQKWSELEIWWQLNKFILEKYG